MGKLLTEATMAEIKIPQRDILSLNLAPLKTLVQSILLDEALADHEQKFQLKIDFPQEANDPVNSQKSQKFVSGLCVSMRSFLGFRSSSTGKQGN